MKSRDRQSCRSQPPKAARSSPAFLTTWRGEVRERPVSTRRAPLDDPHFIKDAYVTVR